MEILDFKEKIDQDKLYKVANCVKEGGIAVFPTETVYGIGANALDEKAVSNIFKAKGRPSDNPLIVHISDLEMLKKITDSVNEIERKLMEKFWPGPLTIVLPKKDVLPDNVTCGLSTVGIRMPNNEIALKLIQASGVPIAAPSANISGRPSGTTIEDIYSELKDKVDYMIDSSTTDIGVESTVIKVVGNDVMILRPGKISPEDIFNLGINVKLDGHLFKVINENENVESPGMKHRHYAPNTKTVLIDGNDNEKVCNKILSIVTENIDKKVAIISYEENKYKLEKSNTIFFSLGNLYDLDTISKNIFRTLRKIDKQKVDFCIIQGVKKKE